MEYVYHSSVVKGLKSINKYKSNHQKECVYAVDNEVIALLFACKSNGDFDTDISINNDNIPEIVERWPGILVKNYSFGASLYKLDRQNFNHYDYLWKPEMISFYDENVIEEIDIPNVLDKLKEYAENKQLIIWEFPSRPDYIPLDNSDLIKRAKKFEEMGFEGSEELLYQLYPQLKELI